MDEDELLQEAQARALSEGVEVERTQPIQFSRAKGGPAGSFNMTLATNGEASDGHILNIPGAQIPEGGRIPLLLGHYSSDSIPALGGVTEFRKSRGNPQRLRARGQINLEGGDDDGLLPARRGVLNLIEAGDLGAVSVRWRGEKSTARTNLPKNHPAFIEPDGPSPQRWGVFFERWTPLEGSVVAVGADPQALIGRAIDLGPETEQWVRGLSLDENPQQEAREEFENRLAKSLTDFRTMYGDDELAATLARLTSPEAAAVELIRYPYLDGETAREHWLPRGAHDALTGSSLSEVLTAIEGLGERMSQPAPPTPAPIPAPAPIVRQRTISELTPGELGTLIGEAAANAAQRAIEPESVGRIRR